MYTKWIHWYVIPSKYVSEIIKTIPHSTRTIANKNLGHTIAGRTVEQENVWTQSTFSAADSRKTLSICNFSNITTVLTLKKNQPIIVYNIVYSIVTWMATALLGKHLATEHMHATIELRMLLLVARHHSTQRHDRC
jgi:hypothetical protein